MKKRFIPVEYVSPESVGEDAPEKLIHLLHRAFLLHLQDEKDPLSRQNEAHNNA